jgi:cystathionine beta-lyase/cystathionine gamma-synthase
MPDLTTLLIHPDCDDASHERARMRPIVAGIERSTIHTLDGPGGEALAAGVGLREADVYGRFGTPTTREAAKLVARLEHGEAGLVTASGMAAITTALTTLVPAGGRFVCAEVVYGGTDSVIARDLAARGVTTVRFDAEDPNSLRAALREGGDLVWCESITNPLLQITPMAALARVCEEANVPLGVDATFAGGMAQHPLQLGAKLVVHSATKYLNGHSDVIAGVIVSDAATVDRCHATLSHTGCCLDPQAAWLLSRGLRTLPLRWARQVETASKLARLLQAHAAIARVHHPSLDPERMAGAPLRSPGGVLAFELADAGVGAAFLAKLRLISHATSLGGLETTICSPARTSHAAVAPALRRARGIADGLLRLSVGLEDPDDLWADLQAALR